MSHLRNLPRAASLIDVFRAYPEISKSLGELHQEIMRRESAFTKGERELMASFVSALNGCKFCVGIHEATAEAFGIEPGLLSALVKDIDSAEVTQRMKPVLRFIAKLTLEPSKIVQTDTDAIFTEGWDDKAIFDAVCVCSFYSFMNRYVDGTGLEAAPEKLRWMGEQLAAGQF